MNKNTKEMQELLHEKGINWNDYPAFFKKGVYLTRRKIVDETSESGNVEVKCSERTEVKELEIPHLKKIDNRVGVLFKREKPSEGER